MTKRMIPRSMKKFIRKEKARIKSTTVNRVEAAEQIKKLYAPFTRGA